VLSGGHRNASIENNAKKCIRHTGEHLCYIAFQARQSVSDDWSVENSGNVQLSYAFGRGTFHFDIKSDSAIAFLSVHCW